MKRTLRRWLPALPAAGLVLGAAGLVLAHGAGAATGLTASYQKVKDWSGGFQGTVTIANGGTAAVTGWRVEFDLPAGETVSSAWRATVSHSGTHWVFVNVDYDATVPAGGAVDFGFNGAVTGAYADPTGCMVNGDPCGAGGGTTGSPTPTATAPPTSPPPTSPPPTSPPPGGGTDVNVSTPAQLTQALAAATAGQTIHLAPGTYKGAFFAYQRSGSASSPITLTGPATAVLTSDGGCDPNAPSGVSYCNYGLHLNHVSYWHLTGFTVASSAKGIMLDNSTHNVIDGVEVRQIGQEGVHFRRFSSDNTIRDSYVHDTGTSSPDFGEAVYLGSANSHWSDPGIGGPDTSDRNQVLDNRLGPNVAAEEVDVKEGTTGGVIEGNTFDGTGMSGANSAESWVNAKGNDYRIDGNHGAHAFLHGFKVRVVVDGWGCGNSFHGNDANVQASGYGFSVSSSNGHCAADPNVVHSDNTVENAGAGFADIPVTTP
ncbi:MAG: cellulose binding domain-containing protein [Mycobacteriales bacterium]